MTLLPKTSVLCLSSAVWSRSRRIQESRR